MPSAATFTVTDPTAPRRAVDPAIGAMAEHLRADISGLTPRLTGRLAGSWRVDREGVAEFAVTTDVPYARFVEYGTRNMAAAAPVGRALSGARNG